MKVLPIFALLVLMHMPAYALDLKPLPTIMSEIDASAKSGRGVDQAMMVYVMRRCGSIYSIMGNIAAEKLNDGADRSIYAKNGSQFATTATMLDVEVAKQRGLAGAFEDSLDSTRSMMRAFINIYNEDIKRSQIQSGNYFSTEFKRDLEVCHSLSSILARQ